QMWRAHLRGLKLDAVYFDAYAADHVEDAFVSFSSEILALVEKHFAEATDVRKPSREFKKTAINVGKRLAGLVAKVGVRAATLGAVEAADIQELKEIGSLRTIGPILLKTLDCGTTSAAACNSNHRLHGDG